MRVHLAFTPDASALQRLRELLDPRVELSLGPEESGGDCEILVSGRLRPEDLQDRPALRMLVIPWSGLPVSTRRSLLEHPRIQVYNLHHNAAPVAEMTLALLLAASKFLIPTDRALRRHDWTPRYEPAPSILLEGRQALVLGYGAIGRRVARLCRGLGMQVTATRWTATEPAEEEGVRVHPARDLPELLPLAEALLICLPLTERTEGAIGEAELASMPPGAVLVNIGRGPIVQQEPLYRALRDRRLRAAGLDVWYSYPSSEEARTSTPVGDLPFHELDNLVMSPHRAGFLDSAEAELVRMSHLATTLNAAVRGEEIPHPVDPREGY